MSNYDLSGMRVILWAASLVSACIAGSIGIDWWEVGAGERLMLTVTWAAWAFALYVGGHLWVAFGDWWRGAVR